MTTTNYDRAALFTKLPETKEDALKLLTAFKLAGLVWHLDEDPLDPGLAALAFTAQEAEFIFQFIEKLNALFGAESANPAAINAGAWHAAELVGWGETETEPVESEGKSRAQNNNLKAEHVTVGMTIKLATGHVMKVEVIEAGKHPRAMVGDVLTFISPSGFRASFKPYGDVEVLA